VAWALLEFGYVGAISEALVEFNDNRLEDLDPTRCPNGVEVSESRFEVLTNFLNHRDDAGGRHKHLTLKKKLLHVKSTSLLFEALKITKVRVRDEHKVSGDEKLPTVTQVSQGYAILVETVEERKQMRLP